MTDLLLEKLGKAKSPWWMYLLVFAVTVAVALLKLKSKALVIDKKIVERQREKAEMEFALEKDSKKVEEKLRNVRELSVKINSIDDEISQVDADVKKSISRINSARSFKDLQG